VVEFERVAYAKFDRIAADVRLTGKGRALDKRAVKVATLDGISKWLSERRAAYDRLDSHLLELLRGLAAVPRPTDPGAIFEAALLRQEVRRAASTLPPEKLQMLYRSGTPTVRQALEELPQIVETEHGLSVRPFVTQEMREEALFDIGRRERPELVQQLEDGRGARRLVESACAIVAKNLQHDAPDPDPKIAELAAEPHDPEILILNRDGSRTPTPQH
jgi:hypothetical protein